jgi:hypothetical protein
MAYKGRIKGGQNYDPKVERKTHLIVSYQNTTVWIPSIAKLTREGAVYIYTIKITYFYVLYFF